MGSMVVAAQSTYVVKAGDSLWDISRSCGISVDEIKQLNGLSSERLSIGQTLKLSKSVNIPTQQVKINAGSSNVYVVASGDSLWSIAGKCGTSVEKILALNGLKSEKLQIGDKLIISGNIPAVKPVPAPAPVAAPAPTPAPAPVAEPVSRSGENLDGARLVDSAAQYLGTPYQYSGSSPGGFDCSGFTSYVFGQAGISLPRTAAGQFDIGTAVDRSELMAGDLVFFRCGGGGIDHVGIYCDNGKFIHSSSPRSGGVIYSYLSEAYYNNSYAGAKRIVR